MAVVDFVNGLVEADEVVGLLADCIADVDEMTIPVDVCSVECVATS